MYGGAGGGLLYAPARSPWAAGLSVDALWQRAPDKTFGFTGYNTVTAIASLHYKLAEGYMPSVHAGRFLAKDWGARFEFKRRFRSGIELGAWYTWTNGNDTTGPAVTEGSGTYQDKGVFAVIPLEAMLTRDTQVKATMSFSPWLRDVGQMVVPPTDLFGLVQDGWINMRECAGLEHFGELDEPAPCSQFTTSLLERPLLPLALNDSWSAGSELNLDPTWRYLALGVGLTLVSSSLDRQADKWVRDNPNNGTLQNVTDFGNNLPYAALGVAGLLAIDETDPRRSRTALSAVEAGVLGLLASETLKYPFGRARPKANQGPDDFQPFSQPDPGLPSTHATVMWATVTPFAKEYDMPWLYGLAAVTNFARMYDREHWLSDTVAGAAIGYGLGTMLWDWNRRKDMPQVGLQKNSVTLKWDLN
jgi:membrane-associated phospholipid phosphatase